MPLPIELPSMLEFSALGKLSCIGRLVTEPRKVPWPCSTIFYFVTEVRLEEGRRTGR